jgi:cytoskeletal protein RodZ
MMKNRSFLFGLGTGLIAGALLLQLMISGGAAPLTKEQVLQGAEKLNMKVIDESAESSSDEVVETNDMAEGSQENVEPSVPAAAASPSPVISPTILERPDKVTSPVEPSEPSTPAAVIEKPAVTPDPAAVAPATPKVTANTAVSVRIPDGSTLTETANILEKAGAIKDKELFLKAAKKRKINTIIRSGSYSFTKGEDIDSVIEKIINLK